MVLAFLIILLWVYNSINMLFLCWDFCIAWHFTMKSRFLKQRCVICLAWVRCSFASSTELPTWVLCSLMQCGTATRPQVVFLMLFYVANGLEFFVGLRASNWLLNFFNSPQARGKRPQPAQRLPDSVGICSFMHHMRMAHGSRLLKLLDYVA